MVLQVEKKTESHRILDQNNEVESKKEDFSYGNCFLALDHVSLKIRRGEEAVSEEEENSCPALSAGKRGDSNQWSVAESVYYL